MESHLTCHLMSQRCCFAVGVYHQELTLCSQSELSIRPGYGVTKCGTKCVGMEPALMGMILLLSQIKMSALRNVHFSVLTRSQQSYF